MEVSKTLEVVLSITEVLALLFSLAPPGAGTQDTEVGGERKMLGGAGQG